MKKLPLLRFMLLLALSFAVKTTQAQNPVNWTKEQLMEPSELAQALQSGKNVPVIISVGPAALIPQSVNIGSVQEKSGQELLVKALKGLDKDAAVVVYCGCCPYEHCPNVRPAIDLLKEAHFTNYKLLDLPHNIKADWLDKGYPKTKL